MTASILSAMRMVSDIEAASLAVADAFGHADRTVVLTGAGISTESGIPDFRSPGGIWSRVRPIEFADFVRCETARLADWRRRFEMAERFSAAEPNAAHLALARLAHQGRIELLATQNIDGLHEKAGTPQERLVELHGTGAHAACLDCEAQVSLAAAKAEIDRTGTAPRCRACGGLIKAAVISFGQPMPAEAMQRAVAASCTADLFVAAGSSLVVYPAAALPQLARQAGARLIVISREETALDKSADIVVRTPLAATFAPLAAALAEGLH